MNKRNHEKKNWETHVLFICFVSKSLNSFCFGKKKVKRCKYWYEIMRAEWIDTWLM
jgi:hypothetical protein